MSKRKRDDDLAHDGADAPHDYRKQRQIVHAFEESAKKLARAFKLAKGFERQKLGRRKKQAVTDNKKRNDEHHVKDADRIDAEIAALKTLDPNTVAEQYLSKSLLKIKAISAPDSSVLPKSIQDSWTAKAAATSDTTILNVIARLCNSNPIKEAFPAVWAEITGELGVDDGGEGGIGPGRKKKRLRASDFVGQAEGKRMRNEEASDGEHRKAGSDDTTERMNDGFEESEEEFMGFDNRLASPSGSDSDDNEDIDVEELERQLAQEGISRKGKYDFAADLSLSEDESEAEAVIPEPQKAAAPKKSAFLPSLTMGGYISGSGSDLDDDDLDVAPKKNRRGQRARQQIWEKKFGTRAKHLQTQNRKQGWDPKRGATDGRERGKKSFTTSRGSKQSATQGQERATGANSLAVQKPRRDDTGSLHPSWEAAKRAKEKKNSLPTFQGKKISFD